MSSRMQLNAGAIKALALIILTAIVGIILLSLWGMTLRYGLLGAETSESGGVADEALSILGNVASAAVGGLVGWLTRDYVETKNMLEIEPDTREVESLPMQVDEWADENPTGIAPGDNED